MRYLFDFFTKLFGKDWALKRHILDRVINFKNASVAMIVAFFFALYNTVTGVANALTYAMPDWVVIASSWVIPNNWNEILTAYITVYIAIALYRWQKAFIGSSSILS